MNYMRIIIGIAAAFGLVAGTATAQYGGSPGGGTAGGGASTGSGSTGSAPGGSTSAVSQYNFHSSYHIGFDRPEAWGLKYFASTSLLSGLPVPEAEDHRVGSISLGLEVGWLPSLDAGQRQIGFNGTSPEDLNKAPIFARPVVRIGLPDKFTAVIAAPPLFEVFGVKSRLLAFGLERPLWHRDRLTVSWRGYGQIGSVKGAFTCPTSVLAFAPGSPSNPTECVGESDDVASLRYAGSEFQLAYRLRRMPKWVPHVAVGGNFIDGAFHVHAPVQDGLDETRLWTRGGTFSSSGGVTYLFSKRASFTVDAFYSPLWVQRSPSLPRTNDGLFNVRALVSYTFR
jgi:hypothetical protein